MSRLCAIFVNIKVVATATKRQKVYPFIEKREKRYCRFIIALLWVSITTRSLPLPPSVSLQSVLLVKTFCAVLRQVASLPDSYNFLIERIALIKEKKKKDCSCGVCLTLLSLQGWNRGGTQGQLHRGGQIRAAI